MKIDTDILAQEIIDSWVNGNITWVIDKLSTDHAGLTALVLVQGASDRSLSLADCNSIANRLIDRRQELAG